jgi:anti-sigma B factor antagonist
VHDLAQIQIDIKGEVIVARVTGEIDISNVGAVKQRLTAAVPNTATGLVVDLAGTTHLDSSGVYLLFELARALDSRQQQICVVAPSSAPTTRVLVITGFDKIVPVADTVDGAVERVGAEGASPSLHSG